MELWNISSSKVDDKGLKTTISVTTEDEEVIASLLDEPDSFAQDFKTKPKAKEPKKANKKDDPKKILPAPVKTNNDFQSTGKTKACKKTDIPIYKPVQPSKLEPVKKDSPKKLPAPKNTRATLKRNPVTGKGTIIHNSRNLNETQIMWTNHNSFNGTGGTISKNSYEAYRKAIEFSGLSVAQKDKLLDKLYKLYSPILKYRSQWYSPMVSGPARYPQAKMDKIYERMMEANSKFIEWWHSIEPQLEASHYVTKEDKKKLEEESKKKELERIKNGFNHWYNCLLAEIPEYQKRGRELKYSSNASLAQSYVVDALKVDTNLYKELFEKLNKVCNFSKNSNFYKSYKFVFEGKLSSDSIQRQEAEDNKVIYSCSDYEVSNLKIQAGKRIAIKFTFYPKPQLVWALKKRGYTWYSFGDCFICKPERFDLDWAKGIKKQYEKYL